MASDPVVPPLVGELNQRSSTGSIQNSLANQLPFSTIDYGTPGGSSQLRGFGSSSEDVDVQAFGISLNPAQGGGFDLSVFPQFLWSGYRFSHGPSLNGLNPSASSGTLTLTPWTVSALRGDVDGSKAEMAGFYSSIGVSQIHAAFREAKAFGDGTSVVAGYSSIKMRGPSAGLSVKWNGGNIYSGSVHFLGSDLESDSIGSVEFSTPHATVRKSRLIPVLQSDFKISQRFLVKNSIFYDFGKTRYLDPDLSFDSNIEATQWGTENLLIWDSWKMALNVRRMFYSPVGAQPLNQDLANVQVTRNWHFGPWLFSPSVQAGWLSGFGGVPALSLGLVRSFESKEYSSDSQSIYARFGFSKKVPSLVDRYAPANEFGFRGNQNLESENDWTSVLGWSLRRSQLDLGVQGYFQYRSNVRVLTQTTTVNMGDAQMGALTLTGRYGPTGWLDISNSASFTRSKLFATGGEFPYIAGVVNIFGIKIRPLKGIETVSYYRINGPRKSSVESDTQLPGYVVMDTGINWAASKEFTLSARVENVFDRSIEVVRGYPIERSISLFIYGEI